MKRSMSMYASSADYWKAVAADAATELEQLRSYMDALNARCVADADELGRARADIQSLQSSAAEFEAENSRLRAALRAMLHDDDHDAAKVAARAALGE